jgi:hypothetical protein
MALSLAKGRAGTLLNELFAVAEKPEQESARFAFSGNLFDSPNWTPRAIHSVYARSLFNTRALSARSIPTVITLPGLSSFTIVVMDVDGETAADTGGITSWLPGCASSSIVEKLLNVDLSRFEDGDMLCRLSSAHRFSKSAGIALTSERSLRRRRQVGAV